MASQNVQAMLAVLAVFCIATASAADATWAFHDFVKGALSSVTGRPMEDQGTEPQAQEQTEPEIGGVVQEEPAEAVQPADDAIVCTQEVVCGDDGQQYPNPCLAAEAGVKVVACPEESRSAPLLGIPDALIDIGQNLIDVVTSPLNGVGAAKDNKEDENDGGFNPVDPLGFFNDPFDNLFQGLGRRLLMKKAL